MMFSFPPILDGNASVKLSNNADSGFPKPIIGETFYSIKDGNWSDTNVWQTASGRVGLLPTANDDVYIRNNVILDTLTVNSYNLYATPNAILRHNGQSNSNRAINIFGNLTFSGSIINVNGSGCTITLNLYGTVNSLNSYSAEANSFFIAYARNGNQDLMNINYQYLNIGGSGTKYAKSNIVISSTLWVNSGVVFELGQYDLDCNLLGDVARANNGTLSKQAYGSVLFRGAITPATSANFLFDGNPLVECRSGITSGSAQSFTTFRSGTGTWTFTTNNQSLGSTNLSFSCPILIDSGITLTIGGTYATSVTLNNTINGVSGTSKLLCSGTTAPTTTYNNATQPMATGILDTSTNLNTWIYGSGNQNIKGGPSLVAKQVYRNLTLNGGGTKTLQGYVSVLNTYTLTSPATLALNGFTLTNP